MNKQALRLLLKEKRKLLTEDWLKANSMLLVEHFMKAVDLTGIQYYAAYLPIAKFNEPDTLLLINKLSSLYTNAKCVVPKVLNDEMEMVLYQQQSELRQNKWNILEPHQSITVPSSQIDLILMPFLGVNSKGYRIGYGKGFYDKYLTNIKQSTILVGYGFDLDENISFEAEYFDVPMQLKISQHGIVVY